jgi:hypothetical protein
MGATNSTAIQSQRSFSLHPAPFLRRFSDPISNGQPGTACWTHPHLTHSKQRTGVEPARNFIPTPSTIAIIDPVVRIRTKKQPEILSL